MIHKFFETTVRATIAALVISLITVISPQATLNVASAAQVDTSTEGFAFDISLAPSRSPGTIWRIYIASTGVGTAVVDWPVTVANTNLNLTEGGISEVIVAEADRVASGARGEQNKNIKITSNVGISVYACWVQPAASDCTNFYPTATWGTKYRTLYTPASIGEQVVSIVTGNTPATVSLRPMENLSSRPNTLSSTAATNITIPANRSYVLGTTAGDFSGMLITSNAPVAVLNGAECVNFNSLFGTAGACDMASQSVPPVAGWGTNFYSVNYRNFGNSGSGYRILADQDNTVVTISGDTTGITPTTPSTFTLQAGQIRTFKAFSGVTDQPHKSIAIKSNNPVLVAHYMFNGGTSTAYRGATGTTPTNGDPSMSYVTPFEQFLNAYSFASPTGLAIANVNIVAPATAVGKIKLDGVTVPDSEFRTIAGSTWKSAQLAIATGTHRIVAPQAFGIQVYGAGSADSYAYTGGANTSPISNVADLGMVVANENGIVGQNVCLKVRVLDANGSPVLGVRVDASISGASGVNGTNGIADSNGVANICYTGTATGNDSVLFTANGFTASATVTWTLTAPAISYTPNTVQLATGAAMRSLAPTNTGGTAASWAISPSLPSGLSFSTTTGVISGTPAANFSATQFSITATNATGTSTATTVTLSSAAAQTSTVGYNPTTLVLTLDAPYSITPTVTGTFPSWSVAPSLPSGLSINPQNGVISGTPDRVSSAANYVVTATNSAGSTTRTLVISVVATAPVISFSPSTYTLFKDVAAATIAPRNTGSQATSWSISPSLPAGLAFNPVNGNISGTATAASNLTTYTVTATNSAGSSTATVALKVENTVTAPIISYSTNSVSTPQNQPMASLTPTNTGGTATGWTISPALPAGLGFTSSTGRISGTPTTAFSATTFTVTATNAGGSSSTTISIESSVSAFGNKYVYSANGGLGTVPATQTYENTTLVAPTTTLAPPSGYEFGGWCLTQHNAGVACTGTAYAAGANLPNPSSSSVTLFAVWTAVVNTVTFNYNGADGGTRPVSANFSPGGTAITLPAPTKSGFVFAGWFAQSDFSGSALQSPYSPTQDLPVFAKWAASDATIAYNANNGTGTVPVDTATVSFGGTFTVLGNPTGLTRTGYTFGGWARNSGGTGTIYNSGSPLVAEAGLNTLYVKWIPNVYTITYNTNGATGSAERVSNVALLSETYTVGTTPLTVPLVGTLVKTGHDFAGWSETPNGADVGANYTPTATGSLFARWTVKTITVGFDKGALSAVDIPNFPTTSSGHFNTVIALPNIDSATVTANSVEYRLAGWRVGAIDYAPGSSYRLLGSNDTLTAVWSPLFEVRYLLNGGTWNRNEFDAQCAVANRCTDSQTIQVDTDVPTRFGYTFAGWGVETATAVTYSPTTVNRDLIVGPSSYLLNALWTPKSFGVTYVPVGGSSTPTQTPLSLYDTFTVSSAITKTGHVFRGWKDQNNVVYGAGAIYSVDTSTVLTETTTVTLTAEWTPEVYSVSYDWNGGTGDAEPSVNYNFGDPAIQLPTVGNRVRDGRTFNGWSATRNGTQLDNPYTPTESTTLFARWSFGNYIVSFDKNFGNNSIETRTAGINDQAIGQILRSAMPTPTRQGFVFKGWFDSRVGGNAISFTNDVFSTPASVTVYARWRQASLEGIEDVHLTLMGTLIASSNSEVSFTRTAQVQSSTSAVTVRVPSGSLPNGTVVSLYAVSDFTRATTAIREAGNVLVSVVVAWLAPDGTVPDTDVLKPIEVTIRNSNILRGAPAFSIVGPVGAGSIVDPAARSTVDGEVKVNLFSDPEIVVKATRPSAPSGISATNGENATSSLTWVAPTNNGGSPITGYTVTSSPAGVGCTVTSIAPATPATACALTGLTNGTNYTFTVTATNAIGTSDPSAPSTSIRPEAPGAQVVTWNPATTIYMGQSPYKPTADASTDGNGFLDYRLVNAGTSGCTVDPNTGTITFTAPGTCVVDAVAAPAGSKGEGSKRVSFSIIRIPRTVAIDRNFEQSYRRNMTPPLLTSTPSIAAGTFTYTSSTPSVCTVNAASGQVRLVEVGACRIYSQVSIDGNYAEATSAEIAFNVLLPLEFFQNPPAGGGGGGGGAPKQTALYFKAVDPANATRVASKTICVDIYSRDLFPQFLASGCSDASGNINVLSADAKVTVKVYELGYGTNAKEYTGEVGGDAFTLDGASYFAGTTRWAISAPAGSSTVTPTPVTPTERPNPSLDPVTKNGKLEPGSFVIEIDGKPSAVTVAPNSTNNGLVITGAGWSITLFAEDGNGGRKQLSPLGYLEVVEETNIRAIGDGLLANSDVRFYLLPNNGLLGLARAASNGRFEVLLPLSSSIKPGTHTLQINAIAPNKDLRSFSVGIVVAAKEVKKDPTPPTTGGTTGGTPTTPKPPVKAPTTKTPSTSVIDFAFGKFVVTPANINKIKRMALRGTVSINIVGYAQNNGGRDDLRISLDRAIEVRKAILKIAPRAKVTVLGGGTTKIKACTPYQNRCAVVKVVKR